MSQHGLGSASPLGLNVGSGRGSAPNLPHASSFRLRAEEAATTEARRRPSKSPTISPMQTLHTTSHTALEAVNREAKDGSTIAQEDAALCREDDGKSATDKPDDPWNPPRPPPHPSIMALTCPHQYNMKYLRQIADFLSEVRATNIIVPDRSPKETRMQFYDIFGRLANVLKEDSVSGFLGLFKDYRGHLASGYVITPQTLDLIITENALRCAKLVLEGKAPELRGMRANPNYMTSFGYFPLHITAQMFSADMVKILLRYGALANLRTSGERIIEGLLPLHVAIENTCQHTYLEDNLLADESYLKGYAEYIYKLIHLLCLPEMKIFLDTIRLLAAHTYNVVDELWNYIDHVKIVPAAILLLAAQRRFRKINGFDTIKTRIDDSIFSLIREGCGLQIGKYTKAAKQRKEKEIRFYNALFLVRILLKAGEALDAYIQTHSKASHQEVHEKVSAILQDYDVGPLGKGIYLEELKCRSYDCRVPDSVLHGRGDTDSTKTATGSPTLDVKAKKAVRRKPRRGEDLWYARDRFIPVWRSVLSARFITRFIPSYVPKTEFADLHPQTQIQLGLLERRHIFYSPFSASNCRPPRRRFGTATSTLLKTLKRL